MYRLSVVFHRKASASTDCIPHISMVSFLLLLLFHCSVMSNLLRLHGPQHAKLPCPSLSPRACSNSCPLSQWCHPIPSAIPFSFCLQSFPALGYFPMSQLFTSGGQSTGSSASASVHLRNIQHLFPLGLTGLISLQFKGLSRVFFIYPAPKHQLLGIKPSLWSSLHIHFTMGKTIALTIQTFVGKLTSLYFNMLSRFIIAFVPRSKCLLISWLQSPSAVILEPKKIRFVTVSIVSPSIWHEVMGPDAMILVFENEF